MIFGSLTVGRNGGSSLVHSNSVIPPGYEALTRGERHCYNEPTIIARCINQVVQLCEHRSAGEALW